MNETGKQVEALKADVKRLKKEARRQKGLLAIARVQLNTKVKKLKLKGNMQKVLKNYPPSPATRIPSTPNLPS